MKDFHQAIIEVDYHHDKICYPVADDPLTVDDHLEALNGMRERSPYISVRFLAAEYRDDPFEHTQLDSMALRQGEKIEAWDFPGLA